MDYKLMNKQFFLLILLLEYVAFGLCKIRFADIYGDHMVLQRAPRRAVLWGYADTIGDTVTVKKNGVFMGQTLVYRNITELGGIWKLKLLPEVNPGPYSITARSTEGEITINDVMFGDVWICSGQSNMQFTMKQVNNSAEEIDKSIDYPDVRMFFTKLTQSKFPVDDAAIDTPWVRPTKGLIDRFSALCFMFGKNIYDQYRYPIGLIESNWGGTKIEVWSSPEATAACSSRQGHKRWTLPRGSGVLWNSMIHPFLNMTIYGAIWYQGESNAGAYDLYSCQFPAMISDWRQKFHKGSDNETSDSFPFGFVQLAPYREGIAFSPIPNLRWAQTANVGYVPNPKMNNTFMAVAMDLPDFHSPSGSIHPRFKQDIAARLSLAARNVAYGESSVKSGGPFPTGYHVDSQTQNLTLIFDSGRDFIQMKRDDGFEICCAHSATSDCKSGVTWRASKIIDHTNSTIKLNLSVCPTGTHSAGLSNKSTPTDTNSTITLDLSVCPTGTHCAGLRYEWKESPCSLKQCAIYSAISGLPAPPFIHTGGF